MTAHEPTPAPVEETPAGVPWRLGLLAGGAIFAFGLYGLLHNARATLPVDWFSWVAGALILHDALLLPAVLVAGFLLVRLVPATVRAGLQGTLAVCATVALMSVPVVLAKGRAADNPSLLPHDYAKNLAIVLVAILAGGMLITVLRAARSRRRSGA